MKTNLKEKRIFLIWITIDAILMIVCLLSKMLFVKKLNFEYEDITVSFEDEALLSDDGYKYIINTDTNNDETVYLVGYLGDKSELIIPSQINGKKVVKIEYGTFSYCESIKKVVIPETVISIGDWAFAGCKELEEIVIPGNVEEIGVSVFINTSPNFKIECAQNTVAFDYAKDNQIVTCIVE